MATVIDLWENIQGRVNNHENHKSFPLKILPYMVDNTCTYIDTHFYYGFQIYKLEK